MSCSLWRWTEECDHRLCVGDCDLCDCNLEEDEEDETYTVSSRTISFGGVA